MPQKVAHNFFCHYKTILVCDVYLIKLLLNNQKIVVAACPHEILAMSLFRFEYTAITKIMLNRYNKITTKKDYNRWDGTKQQQGPDKRNDKMWK